MGKPNFYSGCHYTKNYVVEDYIKGLYYDKKVGGKVPIPESVNKYNKQFLMQLSDLNVQFFGLLRADDVLIKLLKMHKNASPSDLHILYNLMRAQGGTIRYNKILKASLKKYAIQKQEIYDTLKRDLKRQEERVGRNKKLINDIMSDFGLDSLKQFIQETTGRDIVDDILQFTLDNDINMDFKGQADADEETKKQEIQAYYDNLDHKYIDYLLSNANDNGVELFETISADLERHHQKQEQMRLESKQRKKEYNQQVRQNKAIELIEEDNCKLSKAINNNEQLSDYGRNQENSIIEGRISMRSAIELQQLINRMGCVGYYVAICKGNKVYYATLAGRLTTSIMKAFWLTDLEEAEAFFKALEERGTVEKDTRGVYGAKIQKLQTNIEKTVKLSELDSLMDVIENHLKYYSDNNELRNRVLNRYLVDTLNYEIQNNVDKVRNLSNYTTEPYMRMVVLYTVNNKKIMDIKYLLDYSLTEDKKSRYDIIKYRNCNDDIVTIKADIGRNLDKVALMSILKDSMGNELVGTISKYRLEQFAESKGQYKVIPYTYRFNFGTYLDYMYNIHENYLNEIRKYFQTSPCKLGPCAYAEHYIQSQPTHIALLKRLNNYRDKEGLQRLYIILAGHNDKIVMSAAIKEDSDLTLRRHVSRTTAFYKSYNEAMKAIIELNEISDKELYTIHEVDLRNIVKE